MRPQVGRSTRVKKLQPRVPQQVLRQDQIESDEYDSLQGQYKVETGVEKSEESEIHLQAALAGTGGDKETEEIPAPPAQESSDFDYDSLYPPKHEKPATYIRFSQTVEECTGCQYNMTTEDDTYLKSYNQKRPGGSQLSEDGFEKIMEVFENAALMQSPFASVDQTLISFEMMKPDLAEKLPPSFQAVTKDIYEYWKTRRQESANRPLQPTLKFETQPDHDDGDPYVCFRRREARLTRKTRARDTQSVDKLKRLRKELETAKELIDMASRREGLKRNMLKAERGIYEQRRKVKESKIRLGIKGDDEDLINQAPRKRKAPADYAQGRPGQQVSAPHIRMPARPDGRPLDADLETLADVQARKENLAQKELEVFAQKHRQWNEKFIDVTREPLSPVNGAGLELAFRPAIAQYQLMTPPSSVASESSGEHASPSKTKDDASRFRFSSPPEEDEPQPQPAYRRRIGRLNRLWIDRRGMSTSTKELDETVSDRWKYDQDDDDEQPVYEMDPNSTPALKFRSTIPPFMSFRSLPPDAQRSSSTSPGTVRKTAAPQAAPT